MLNCVDALCRFVFWCRKKTEKVHELDQELVLLVDAGGLGGSL